MSTLWQPEARRALQARIARLTAEQKPSWGRMSAPHMVSHLIESDHTKDTMDTRAIRSGVILEALVSFVVNQRGS